ncbi:MAG: hypothetical protein JSS03_09630, partial [Proteobacteria bacterium]|nr:hypothetical protein [Pseudomonadota bacterium]
MTTKTEATNKRARVGFLLFGAALSLIPILGAIASNAAFASRLGKVQSGIAGSATHSDSNPEDPAPPPPVAIIEQAAVRMPQAQQRQADAIHRY